MTGWGLTASSMLLSCLTPLALQRWAMLCSLAVHGRDSCALPRPRSLAGDLFAALCGLEFSLIFLLLTARPAMSLILVLALSFLLVFLNGVKEQVLHEPLVVVDAWLLKQIFRYPHLYFSYLPLGRVALGTLCLILALGLLLFRETPFPELRQPATLFCLLAPALLPIGALLLLHRGYAPLTAARLLHIFPVSHDPVADAARNGPLAAACMHLVLSGRMSREGQDFLNPARRPLASAWPRPFEVFLDGLEKFGKDGVSLPHVVLVQAETFYDVRKRLSPKDNAVLGNFLPAWDRMRDEGRTLPTPDTAYGAYTMRAEFSTLTGLDARTLGPWYFNPYYLAARRPLWSLARFFREKGYSAVCVHPYAADFFDRDKVMPNLGFERFITLEDLGHLPRFGRYVSDLALAEEIARMLEEAVKPLFCFVITMEAHGPWFPGRLTEEQLDAYLDTTLRGRFSPSKQTYLCHLKRMDRMFAILDGYAGRSSRPVHLVGYGDHAPSLKF